ncbi:phosphate ABC transporter substrate-binding protein PstS family protein [Bacillus sp. RG28]|uniref:Phosphate-binding protein n=1 Tax=Gottfriedia endophytica TaxID=2820819 RepID=A0A940SKI5_9BACI|nr:phosphate ABC transporter substrate-binding protein PstS family protein [Gottfriedia endophytica]MBP0726064.1 phosphate ABC transporter substrate-binding protein PstS family protein [Gottfriedia endophytica]
MKRGLKLTFAAMLVTGVMAGCSNNSDKKASSSDAKQASLSGTVTAAGSTALQPLADEAATEFMSKYPQVSITIQGGGSGTGVNQVTAGAVQIGNSDVPAAEKLTDPSLAKDLVETKVAGIGFSLTTNKDVGVDSLTLQNIKDIFSGKVTNWKDVGGKDEKINVINRPASSGTRAAFTKTVMKDVKINDSIGTVQDSTGSVETAINSTPGSISYLANSYLTGKKQGALKQIKIDGVEPTTENITAGKYPFYSYEYMITKGEAKSPVKEYIDFVKGDEFAKKLEEMGYIPASKMNGLK